ncbi:hypothetical protein HDU90_003986 [Geranomyces variabilis]|nr:hypothetical protein HDU90_003986 [Geranomyces variabilis]
MNAATDNSEPLGSFSETISVQLKNRACKLTVSGNVSADERERGSRLVVKLESAQTREAWQSSFTPAAIEDITKKTGNFKRFSVFVEMLLSSLRKSSEIVQLDFLTSDDLESLKSTQRARANPAPDSSDRDRSWKKVYMILTYAVAFDRVHYPLPLIRDEHGWEPHSGRQNEALAEENAELRSENNKQLQEISALLRENDKLKHKLKHTKTETKSSSKHDASLELAHELNALRIGTQRYLKDIQHELSAFCRKHGAIQNSPHIFRIEDYLSRLQALIWLFLDDAQPDKGTRHARDAGHQHDRRQSGSRQRGSKPPARDRHQHREDDERQPVAAAKRRRSTTAKAPVPPFPNSGYRVVKSRPLQQSPPPPVRRAATSRPSPHGSRASSVSSFQRFDPTQYIRDRNRKLDERRARSRDRSRSLQSQPASRSSSITSSVDRWRPPPPRQHRDAKDRFSGSSPRRNPPRASPARGGSGASHSRKAAKPRNRHASQRSDDESLDELDWETGTNVDTVEIDRRLAKLYDSIIKVR